MNRFIALSVLALSITTSGCHNKPAKPQFWQRASVSDAAYQQGPKAQQMLDRDIARCVTELRELERLGNITDSIPPNLSRKVNEPHEERMRRFDDANRDGYVLAEHRDYNDFESCMGAKGWDRVSSVPYDVQDRAYRIYRGEPEFEIMDVEENDYLNN